MVDNKNKNYAKYIIAAVIILVVLGVGYLAYGMLSSHHSEGMISGLNSTLSLSADRPAIIGHAANVLGVSNVSKFQVVYVHITYTGTDYLNGTGFEVSGDYMGRNGYMHRGTVRFKDLNSVDSVNIDGEDVPVGTIR